MDIVSREIVLYLEDEHIINFRIGAHMEINISNLHKSFGDNHVLKGIDLYAKNKIVLFSSHQMNYIEEFCDDIVILSKGKLVCLKTTS